MGCVCGAPSAPRLAVGARAARSRYALRCSRPEHLQRGARSRTTRTDSDDGLGMREVAYPPPRSRGGGLHAGAGLAHSESEPGPGIRSERVSRLGVHTASARAEARTGLEPPGPPAPELFAAERSRTLAPRRRRTVRLAERPVRGPGGQNEGITLTNDAVGARTDRTEGLDFGSVTEAKLIG
jgi:hypothetical protein